MHEIIAYDCGIANALHALPSADLRDNGKKLWTKNHLRSATFNEKIPISFAQHRPSRRNGSFASKDWKTQCESIQRLTASPISYGHRTVFSSARASLRLWPQRIRCMSCGIRHHAFVYSRIQLEKTTAAHCEWMVDCCRRRRRWWTNRFRFGQESTQTRAPARKERERESDSGNALPEMKEHEFHCVWCVRRRCSLLFFSVVCCSTAAAWRSGCVSWCVCGCLARNIRWGNHDGTMLVSLSLRQLFMRNGSSGKRNGVSVYRKTNHFFSRFGRCECVCALSSSHSLLRWYAQLFDFDDHQQQNEEQRFGTKR